MDANKNRPWHRPHGATVLTVFFMGAGWLSKAYGDVVAVLLGQYPSIFPYATDGGWPFTSIRTVGDKVDGIHWAALVFDTGLLLGCLLAVAVVVERLVTTRFQFSLATLASAVTAFAVVLALWEWKGEPRWYLLAQGLGAYRRMDLRWWSETIPTFLGIVCGAHMTIWILLRTASQSFSRLRRAAPAKVAADASPAR